jgi:hypothetical protein
MNGVGEQSHGVGGKPIEDLRADKSQIKAGPDGEGASEIGMIMTMTMVMMVMIMRHVFGPSGG